MAAAPGGSFLDWVLADLPPAEREQLLAAAEDNLAAAGWCDCDPCCPEHCTCRTAR